MLERQSIRFVTRNLLKGVAILSFFVLIYILFKKFVHVDYLIWLEPFFDNTLLILIIFLISEVFIGIIPPEVFVLWALRENTFTEFTGIIVLLAFISYSAGITGYIAGARLKRFLYLRFLRRKYLKKLERNLQTFGVYLIIIAALTPVPYSGTSMLIGSSNYPFRKFSFYALTRFIRFGGYLVFWWINMEVNN